MILCHFLQDCPFDVTEPGTSPQDGEVPLTRESQEGAIGTVCSVDTDSSLTDPVAIECSTAVAATRLNQFLHKAIYEVSVFPLSICVMGAGEGNCEEQ